MRVLRLFLLMLSLTLITAGFNPASSAAKSAPLTGEKAAQAESASGPSGTGPGEGFEPEAEATKGPEIPSTFGPILSDSAIPIAKGKFSIQAFFAYNYILNVFSSHWVRTTTDGDSRTFNTSWKFTCGPIEDMEIYVIIPYVHNWKDDVAEPGQSGETSAHSGGLSDMNLTLKYRLVEETTELPTVTVTFSTNFPTGKYRDLSAGNLGTDLLGAGACVFSTGFNLSKYIPPFVVYANFWYSMQTAYTNDSGRQYPGDYVTVNLAAEYPITKKWVVMLEMASFWGGGRLFGPDTNVPHASLLRILPAIEYMATDRFSLAVGLYADLIGKNVNAALGPQLSMIYAF